MNIIMGSHLTNAAKLSNDWGPPLAYRALIHMTQRWAEPTDLFVHEDLAMAERIGQDLADISRHIADIQHAYMKALFAEPPS